MTTIRVLSSLEYQGHDTMPNQLKSYNGLHTLMYCIPPNPDRR